MKKVNFRVKTHLHTDMDYPNIRHAYLAYLACLTVSEENKSVVSEQRFMNDVLFYDLNGNIRAVASFGNDRHILHLAAFAGDIQRAELFDIPLMRRVKREAVEYLLPKRTVRPDGQFRLPVIKSPVLQQIPERCRHNYSQVTGIRPWIEKRSRQLEQCMLRMFKAVQLP